MPCNDMTRQFVNMLSREKEHINDAFIERDFYKNAYHAGRFSAVYTLAVDNDLEVNVQSQYDDDGFMYIDKIELPILKF